MPVLEPAVRRAGPDDAPAVLSLWRALMDEHRELDARFRLAPDAEARFRNDLAIWLAGDVHRFWAAEAGGRLLGISHARLWRPPPMYGEALEVYIDEVYVVPDARAKGIGRQLVVPIRQWGEERGAVRLRLGALAGNAAAEGFWRALGAQALSVAYTVELREPSDDDPAPRRPIGFF